MLKLYYAGPKIIINQDGVFFKNEKEDKYIYIKMAVKILLVVNKENTSGFNKLNDNDILEIIKKYEPDLETHIENEEKKYEEHITQIIKSVNENSLLKEEEKSVWLKNIEIMKPTMLQREINKLYYIHCLKHIKEAIYKNHVTEIDLDFDFLDFHILHSIAGNLQYGSRSILTTTKVQENNDGKVVAKLFIK